MNYEETAKNFDEKNKVIIVKTDTLSKRNKLLNALEENKFSNMSRLDFKHIFIQNKKYGSCDENTITFNGAAKVVDFSDINLKTLEIIGTL